MELMRRWKFTPRLWPTLAAMAAIPLLISLGLWQLDRAEEKQRAYRQFAQRGAEPAVRLAADSPEIWKLPLMRHRRIHVYGHYDGGVQYLLDNQVHDGAAGYLVYTPFVLEGQEIHLLIDRGWVAAGPDRGVPPALDTPPGVLSLSGIAALPPPPGIRLGDNLPEAMTPNLVRLQRIEMDAMMRRFAGKLLPYELRLDPDDAGGFIRQWREPGSGHERNLGYAFQWFAMAAVVAVLYLYLNLHRDHPLK